MRILVKRDRKRYFGKALYENEGWRNVLGGEIDPRLSHPFRGLKTQDFNSNMKPRFK